MPRALSSPSSPISSLERTYAFSQVCPCHSGLRRANVARNGAFGSQCLQPVGADLFDRLAIAYISQKLRVTSLPFVLQGPGLVITAKLSVSCDLHSIGKCALVMCAVASTLAMN